MISRIEQRLRLSYPAPVRDCRRELRVLPLQRAGQRVLSCDYACFPPADVRRETEDPNGNRLIRLEHACIPRDFTFQLRLTVETTPASSDGEPSTATEPLGAWLSPTALCDYGPRVQSALQATNVTRDFARALPHEAATELCAWTHARLSYRETRRSTQSASDALAGGTGMCGELAHLFIALCRALSLPARYVTGYNPAEGLMHAWAECCCEGTWRAFDPTHNRAPSPGSVVVAVGRDARECALHAGTYRGTGGARLEVWCRTTVEEERASD